MYLRRILMLERTWLSWHDVAEEDGVCTGAEAVTRSGLPGRERCHSFAPRIGQSFSALRRRAETAYCGRHHPGGEIAS
jgi:hypothetical protein